MILLVHSQLDIAGVNIANYVLENYNFSETNNNFQNAPIYKAEINSKKFFSVTLEQETVYSQNLLETFPDVELIVFLSRHRSKSGTPTLSVHTPGNVGAAELGGLPRQLSIAPAKAMLDALSTMNRLKEERGLDYAVSYECTHHGPSLSAPTMFAELGSSEEQWRDLAAAKVVGQAAVESASKFGNIQQSAVIGIGGTHYNQKFTRMALSGQALFGHMIAKYAIPLVDSKLLKQCVERTFEKVISVVLDWKGIKSDDKPRITTILEDLDLPIMKV
jgi:D-tyrosyl-tRNA(Tyr) deacylase